MSKESRKRYQQKWNLRRQQEILRGRKEAREGIAMLQSLWPAAFPAKPDLVRPLASGIIPAIAGRTGWSRPYARGVLQAWKMRRAYCKAVLNFGKRFDLNGEQVDQTVEADARRQARQRLAAIRARMEARVRKAAEAQGGMPAALAETGENGETVPIASSGQPPGPADLEGAPDSGNGNAGCQAETVLADWRENLDDAA